MVGLLVFFFDNVFDTGKCDCWLSDEQMFRANEATKNWKFTKLNLLYDAALRFPFWIVAWVFASGPLHVGIGITKFHASIVQQIERMSRVRYLGGCDGCWRTFRRAAGFSGIGGGKLIPQY